MDTKHTPAEVEAIANADAYLNNVALLNYSDLQAENAALLGVIQKIAFEAASYADCWQIAQAAYAKSRSTQAR